MSALSTRQRRVLFCLVAEHIATGKPVSSRTLARRYDLELSAATIRNVLADLEEAGLLVQPHTSAGRQPTERALRLFIEVLTEFDEVSPANRRRLQARVEEIYGATAGGRRLRLRETGKLLSELSGAAAVVASSQADRRKLVQLRFIPTRQKQLLAVLVFSDGLVENRFFNVQTALSEAELTRVHNLLAGVVEGQTLGALRRLFARGLDDERVRLDALRRRAFDLGHEALRDGSGGGEEAVIIEGRSRLMEMPEYGDVESLRKLVAALEDRAHLVELLDRTIGAGAVTVYIGSEAGELGDGEADLSLIAAPFGDPEDVSGTVGVLGPKRMDYARMVPLVEATAATISKVIKAGR